jgi:serine/threonine protein kinase/tetratricopeptide (TPR) repeat protein
MRDRNIPPPIGSGAMSEPNDRDLSDQTDLTLLGKRISHYHILERLGGGGMGVVYKAVDRRLSRAVALKFLSETIAHDSKAIERFEREARTASALNHPHICTVYDVGDYEGRQFIVMELLEGKTLKDHLSQQDLTEEQIVSLGIQIADALDAAHAKGILHRDIKPANIFLTNNGQVKVLDFGLAKLIKPVGDLTLSREDTETKVAMGTLPYMAPEQLRGHETDMRTDIWGVGAVLYEMATHEKPFPENQGPLLVESILHNAPPRPTSLNAKISRPFESLVLKTLQKEPQRRYQSARELANDLQRLSTGEVRLTARIPMRILFASAVLVILLASVLSWYFVTEHSRTSHSPRVRRSVAVLGFKDLGMRAETAWLSPALAEMLTTELAAGDQLRTISGERVARVKNDLTLSNTDSFAKDTLSRIRNTLGSDFLVLGSYVDLGSESGGQIRLDLRIQDANSGETVATFAESGTEPALLDLVSRAGEDLRQKLGLSELSQEKRARLKAAQPASAEAVRLYSEALAKLRLFDGLAARDLLERAIASDPNNPLIHSAQADAWAALGYEDRSRREAKRALELSVNLPQAQKLGIEARYLESTSDWDRAIRNYHTLFQLLPDNIEYGLHLATLQRLAGKNKDALVTLDILRRQPSPIGDDPRIDLEEAEASQAISDFKRELVAAGRAVQKSQEQGARFVLAQARVAEGRAFRGLGEADKATSASEEARKLFAAVGDRLGEARVLHNIGTVYYDKGDLENAKEAFEECRQIRHQIGNRRGEAGDLNDIAVVLAHEKDVTGAIMSYRQALNISREIGDLLNEGVALDNLADLQRLNGNFADARMNFKKASEIDRRIGNQGEAARVLNNLALMLTSEGNLAAARANLNEALKLTRDLGDKNGIAIALVNLADIQFKLGELLAAEKLYREAQQVFQSTGAHVYESWPLYGLAEILIDRDDLADARQKHETALALREQGSERGAAAESRLALSRLYREQGQLTEAKAAASKALEDFRQGGDADGQTRAEIAAALCSLEEAKLVDARRAIENARKLSARTNDPALKLELATADARVQIAVGNVSIASALLAQSVRQSRKIGFRELEYDARLALSQSERLSGHSIASNRKLVALREDAMARGYALIAHKAAARIGSAQSCPKARR